MMSLGNWDSLCSSSGVSSSSAWVLGPVCSGAGVAEFFDPTVGFLIFAQAFLFHFFPFFELHDYYKGLSFFRNDKMLVVTFGRSYFMTSSQKIRTE